MKLIFIRHAQSEGHYLNDPEQDQLRELTRKGAKQFKNNLKKIQRLTSKARCGFL
jgi:phosphohistidine phosphatase SixA